MGAAVCLSMLFVSTEHAQSALWGLLAVALPSSVFAIRLAMGSKTPMGGTFVFLAGEFIKVAATVAILFAAGQLDPDIVWWSMMLAAVAALKSYFLAFFLR